MTTVEASAPVFFSLLGSGSSSTRHTGARVITPQDTVEISDDEGAPIPPTSVGRAVPAGLVDLVGTPGIGAADGPGDRPDPPGRQGGVDRRDGRDGPSRPQRRARRRRRALTVLGALAVVAVVPAWSFGSALAAPGNTTASEKSVEWLRDHGMGSEVNGVEHWWFSHHAPKAGGAPDHAIDIAAPPGQPDAPPAGVHAAATRAHTDKPANVPVPDGLAPLPDEGRWQPVGPTIGGSTAMYATQVRPDSVHTSLLDGLVWIDPKLARFEVHPGLSEPGGSWKTPAKIPTESRLDLLAAFNGGFRMQDAKGGFFLEGREQKPLRPGDASFVVNRDGSATVGQWGRDVSMGPDVVAVRQNLQLILDGGQPVAGLDDNSNGAWGDTLGNKVLVWRSAVCSTGDGAIIYGYGAGLGALSLAQLMQRAGCQRAMELDINPAWTSFNFYGATRPGDPASVAGTKLLPDQKKGADRYLSDDSRDFVAVFARPS